jgi:hypothetical protein
MVNEHDNSAIASLLIRYVKAFEIRKAAQELNTKLVERIAQSNVAIANIKTAFSLYDVNIAQDDVWKGVSARIGANLYNQAIREGTIEAEKLALALVEVSSIPAPPPPPPPQQPPDSTTADDEDIDEGEQTAFEGLEEPHSSVRDFTINSLKAAGSLGMKAAEIRAVYETSRDTKLHDKTIGMTLYRLSKDNLARREGRTWFFVPPNAETKDPGGETPGNIEDLL